MEIIELNAQNIIEGFNDVISNKKQCFVYGIPDNNYVFQGTTHLCDCDYCDKNGVKILPIPNEGGVIVISKGDVELGIFKDNGWDICEKYMRKLCEHLKERIPSINYEGNDLIIDGKYKCVGSSSRNLDYNNPYIYTAVHISLNVNLDLINHICQKEMKKIPKGLSDYGFTTDEILEISKETLREIDEVIDNAS